MKNKNTFQLSWFVNKCRADYRPASRTELATTLIQARQNGWVIQKKHWTDGKTGYDIKPQKGNVFRFVKSPLGVN